MGKRMFGSMSVAAILALAMAMLIGGPDIGAQSTPTASDGTEVGPPRPAHIHTGTCDELGDVVYPLNDVQPLDLMASPEASIASPEADVRTAVPESETIVDASLEDLLADEHAINVHESAENIQTYIACGEITGSADEGLIEVDLQELNDSGHAGIATLIANDDGTTTVHVTLVPIELGPVGTPVATPAS